MVACATLEEQKDVVSERTDQAASAAGRTGRGKSKKQTDMDAWKISSISLVLGGCEMGDI